MKSGGKSSTGKAAAVQFFWDKRTKKSSRSRFNLLLLEHGEYLLQDLSAFLFSIPTSDLTKSFELNDALKMQGRLKLCTKSLIFEPSDIHKPVMKFAYKAMVDPLENFRIKQSERERMAMEMSGFFTFLCTQYLEMKANDKIGPYKTVRYNNRPRAVSSAMGGAGSTVGGGASGDYAPAQFYAGAVHDGALGDGDASGCGFRMVIALVHSDLQQFLVKVEQLRHIIDISTRPPPTGGIGMSQQLLQPFIESAMIPQGKGNAGFDSSFLVDYHEQLLLNPPLRVQKVKPLIVNPGCLMLTDARVYFQPSQLNNVGGETNGAVAMECFDLRKILRVKKRRYLLRQNGIELFMADRSSTLFVFDNSELRNRIYGMMIALLQEKLASKGPSNFGSVPDLDRMFEYQQLADRQRRQERIDSENVAKMVRKWQKKEISTFDYLMYLNFEADRSLNDLTQYPVFPHIIADYTSKKLQLSNPATFRDLSKPIGALNAERLDYFRERFISMQQAADEAEMIEVAEAARNKARGIEKSVLTATPPPFLYGTHYSTPGYVLYYLVRVAPEHMLCLQNGKFDVSDRMFFSMAATWDSCLTNPADLKELIPEFFYVPPAGSGSCGDFLTNADYEVELGYRASGEKVDDVELPPWADGSPRDFIRKHAKALESSYVSDHIHEWIDLIFGYKQKGKAAIEADNLFYHLTYEGSLDLEKVTDARERAALEIQIQEFGQTPKQLFYAPHPRRGDLDAPIVLSNYAVDRAETNAGSERKEQGTVGGVSAAAVGELGRQEGQHRAPANSAHVRAQLVESDRRAVVGSGTTHGTDSAEARPHSDRDVDEIAIVRLGEDFKKEVALMEAFNTNSRSRTSTSSDASGGGLAGSSVGEGVGRSFRPVSIATNTVHRTALYEEGDDNDSGAAGEVAAEAGARGRDRQSISSTSSSTGRGNNISYGSSDNSNNNSNRSSAHDINNNSSNHKSSSGGSRSSTHYHPNSVAGASVMVEDQGGKPGSSARNSRSLSPMSKLMSASYTNQQQPLSSVVGGDIGCAAGCGVDSGIGTGTDTGTTSVLGSVWGAWSSGDTTSSFIARTFGSARNGQSPPPISGGSFSPRQAGPGSSGGPAGGVPSA